MKNNNNIKIAKIEIFNIKKKLKNFKNKYKIYKIIYNH